MGMWTTENQDTLSDVLKAFSEAAHQHYGNHSFEAGYLQSTLVSVLPLLPKRQQKVLIEDMIRATQRRERLVIEQRNENRTFERA